MTPKNKEQSELGAGMTSVRTKNREKRGRDDTSQNKEHIERGIGMATIRT